MADWSRLPANLLQMIAGRLVDVSAYIRFRSVCRPWRSSTVEHTHPKSPLALTPWLMLSFDESSDARSFYRLSDGNVWTLNLPEVRYNRIIGFTNGWLVLVDLTSKVRLFNPLTRSQLSLPCLTALPDVAAHYKKRTLVYEDGRIYNDKPEDVRDYFMNKAILIRSHSGSKEHNMVVANVHYSYVLACARPGDDNWIVISPVSPESWFADMLWYRGRLYAVDSDGEVSVCEIGPPVRTISIVSADRFFCDNWYLVESSGDLLLVGQVHAHADMNFPTALKTEWFCIYKLCFREGKVKLEKVRDLGDRMLFLGTSHSVSFSEREFPWCQGNCIYFTASHFETSHSPQVDQFGRPDYGRPCRKIRDGDDFGVFNLKDGTIKSLPCYADNTRFLWPPPIWCIWFTPNFCTLAQ